MKLTTADLVYLSRFAQMTRNGTDLSPIPEKYLTSKCPECGDDAGNLQFPHTTANRTDGTQYLEREDDLILIGCEGYQVIDPKLFGIQGNWDDWTNTSLGEVSG